MHTRLKHHLPVPSQYRGDGPRFRGKRGCGLVVERRESLFWGSHSSFFWGEMSYWDDVSSKRSKHKLESLDACYKGWLRKSLTLIWIKEK